MYSDMEGHARSAHLCMSCAHNFLPCCCRRCSYCCRLALESAFSCSLTCFSAAKHEIPPAVNLHVKCSSTTDDGRYRRRLHLQEPL